LDEFEDTTQNGVCKSKNGQTIKNKSTNNNLQTTTRKTKERATQSPLKPRVNSGAPEW